MNESNPGGQEILQTASCTCIYIYYVSEYFNTNLLEQTDFSICFNTEHCSNMEYSLVLTSRSCFGDQQIPSLKSIRKFTRAL
mmetsp:Transcript_6239/g.8990  ORF Transcript_6239/g.8990 Transcript_6239/m.8990 type:complete len:82 (-) Transcript_6239:896-1141(-)